jgi:uncharacterized Zn-finger protein
MTEPVETIKTTTAHVACDGGGGSLGHPRVFLQIKPQVGHIDCPYCGRRYVLDATAAKAAAGH